MAKSGTKCRFILKLFILIIGIFGFESNVHAKDFVSDFANCATAPLEAAAQTLTVAPEVIKFAAQHSECMPKVVAVDPTLVGMTAGVIGLQTANQLPKSGDACSNAILGPAQRQVAGMIDTTIDAIPGASSIFPSAGRVMLKQVANNEGTATLYQVSGMSMMVENLSCGCAISETGMGVEQLKGSAGTLFKGVASCTSVVNDLFGGGYEAGKAGANAAAAAAQAVYSNFKDAVNAVGCALGLGGCPSESPPFFCVGYQALRGQGLSPDTMKAAFGTGVFTAGFDSNAPICEQDYQNKIEAAIKAEREAAERRRLARELENAQRVASTYALRFAFDWMPKCERESQCETGISNIADLFGKDLADDETIALHGNLGAAIPAIIAKYSNNADIAVKLGRDRRYAALRADLNAPIQARLIAFGCRPFLGRDGKSLCSDTAGLNACKAYVDADRWSMCAVAGSKTFYSSGPRLAVMMRSIGCIPEDGSGLVAPNSLQFSNSAAILGGLARITARAPGSAMQSRQIGLKVACMSAGARQNCDAYKGGSSNVVCGGAAATPLLALTPITLTPGNFPPLSRARLPGLVRRTAPMATPESAPPPPPSPPPTTTIPPLRRLPALRRPQN